MVVHGAQAGLVFLGQALVVRGGQAFTKRHQLPTAIQNSMCDRLIVDNDKNESKHMKNQKLALLNRARMSTLNAIRRFGDTEAEEHFQRALQWLNRATAYLLDGKGGADAAMMNAVAHLQSAAQILGHSPIAVTVH